jgi:hypothetical protein
VLFPGTFGESKFFDSKLFETQNQQSLTKSSTSPTMVQTNGDMLMSSRYETGSDLASVIFKPKV